MQDDSLCMETVHKSHEQIDEKGQDTQNYQSVSQKHQNTPNLVKSTFSNMIANEDMSDFFIIEDYQQDEIKEQLYLQAKLNKGNQFKVQQREIQQLSNFQKQNDSSKISAKQDQSKFLVERTQANVEKYVKSPQFDQQNNLKNNGQEKNIVTRLQMQIQKNSLSFEPIYGQAFIIIDIAKLIGEKRQEKGKLMMTNYRMAFFKERQKLIDVPFGFIQTIKFNEKSSQLVLHLKYRHFWKFQIPNPNVFNNLMKYSQIYLSSNLVKSSFAFTYALRCLQKSEQPQEEQQNAKMFRKHGYCHQKQYKRLQILNNSAYQCINNANSKFNICKTYPEKIYVSNAHNDNLTKQVSIHRINQRFPVLTYLYKNMQKEVMPIWRSSSYIQDNRSISSKSQALMLQYLGINLHVFIAESRVNSAIKDQCDYGKKNKIESTYLNLESLKQMKSAYLQLVGCFLSPKKQFIKEVINTKWYQMVSNLLFSASLIANKVLRGHSVLIRCTNGFDRSAQLSALVLLILDPYYRTFQGFPVLIEKQFVQFGHPFASRLGFRQGFINENPNQNNSQKSEQEFPIFIQFLDCVSQLINLNQMSFQFNHKYLSKLSNVIYTNIFGNFTCNSFQEILQNNVRNETVSVWTLLSPNKLQKYRDQSNALQYLTKNAFYQQKSGILQNNNHKNALSEMRLWRQHFWYLTTALKDTYKLYPFAQDNYDYLNIECLKIKNQNKSLKNSITDQKKKIAQMKQQLKILKDRQASQQKVNAQ